MSIAHIREIDVTIPAADLGPEGLPLLLRGHESDLGARDRELVGELGDRRLAPRPPSLLPYRAQSHYSRKVAPRTFRAVELTNEHLRATFLPELGGRLWSLVDLASGRDLLFQPDSIMFGNLALRDAWFSGGIEWNLGTSGHWGLTCAPVGAGIVDHGGEQVLRMWALERLTGLVWRLDAWLPAGSRHLFTSARIANHLDTDVAFYWWSNAAVPLTAASRVYAPVHSALLTDYEGGLGEVAFPLHDGVDGSRPAEAPRAADYFFDTRKPGRLRRHPWVAAVDDQGAGTMLASTWELPGKKLFMWGNTRGGHRWQGWLNGEGRYLELQSGYGLTQREHHALPPGHVATWVEAFGPVLAPAGDDWSQGRRAVADQVPKRGLRRARRFLDEVADLAPRVLQPADGWGRVEVETGHLPADPAVPFEADLDDEQAAWATFAGGGELDERLARSPLVSDAWQDRLRRAREGWLKDLLLGYCAWARGKRGDAVALWRSSVEQQPNPMALHCLAVAVGDGWEAYSHAERAYELASDDDDLLIDFLSRAGDMPAVVLQVIDRLTDERREQPRVRLALAHALLASGRAVSARVVIDELELPNLRETSGELTELWNTYAQTAGTDEDLPPHLDFRMF